MIELKKALKQTKIVYVTRDLERALACSENGYYIITNSSSFAQSKAKNNPNIFLVSREKTLDTHELLTLRETKDFLSTFEKFSILVFKNTKVIETICQKEKWNLLNPRTEISDKIEEKIKQIEWLGDDLNKLLPKHEIVEGKNLNWTGKPFILQFNRSHSGEGTILIDSEDKIEAHKNNYPNRPMRITEYVPGPTFTNNNVIWGKEILVGEINYQITGIKPFTDNKFATVGNDWDLPKQILSKEQIKSYHNIVFNVGKKLIREGWKGLFGIDVILDEKTGQLYLIEINARQPASSTYESELQKNQGDYPTTFEAHLSSLLELPCTFKEFPQISGAQIIKRNTEKPISNLEEKIKSLNKLDLEVIEYANTENGKELLRIQSKKGIMSAHNEFNELGEKIAQIIG